MGRRTGVSALVEWSLSAALLPLLIISSIGIFLLPVAVAAFVATAARNRVWPYLPFGLVIGIGGLVAAIGLMHLDYVPCRTVGNAIGSGTSGQVVARASAGGSCGGVNGHDWLAVGGILAMVGAAGYVALMRKRPSSRTP